MATITLNGITLGNFSAEQIKKMLKNYVTEITAISEQTSEKTLTVTRLRGWAKKSDLCDKSVDEIKEIQIDSFLPTD